LPDSGQTGLITGPDGGVTIGTASDFKTNFVYMANALDGTVSRITIPGGGLPPYEQARYPALIPIDNHGMDQSKAWQGAITCQFGFFDGGCLDAGQMTPICSFYIGDAGCLDAGQKTPICATAKQDAGCKDAGPYPLVCTTLTSDAGCSDAGFDGGQICHTTSSGTVCVDPIPSTLCLTAITDAGCLDAGQKPLSCSSSLQDAGCSDGGPNALVCTTKFLDGGCKDGGPNPLSCTNITVDAGCTDAGPNPMTCSSASYDAGCTDAGPYPNVCTVVGNTLYPKTDQLDPAQYALNSPSRTTVDRNGNVFVVLRSPKPFGSGPPLALPDGGDLTLPDGAPCPYLQAGVTKIINIGDHPELCVPRCQNRKNWSSSADGGPFPFTAGYAGGTVLLPGNSPIIPGSWQVTTYPCLDKPSNPTDETDPTNYDDCVTWSIPLGDPNPDPNADPSGLTKGTSFGRAGVVSPNCDPVSRQCDVWVGMWNGSSWIRLSYNGGGTGLPYDVGNVMDIGVHPYGGNVDFAGIVWTVGSDSKGRDAITATTTVNVIDPVHSFKAPANTVISDFALAPDRGVTNASDCRYYGIATDAKERVWMAGGLGHAKACSFDGTALLSNYGQLWSPAVATAMQSAWKSYDFDAVTGPASGAPAPYPVAPTTYYKASAFHSLGRGINVDVSNNVFMGIDMNPWNGTDILGQPAYGMAGVSFNPDVDGGIVCTTPGSTGAACANNGTLNWAINTQNTTKPAFDYPSGWTKVGGSTIGVGLDTDGQPWFGNFHGTSTDLTSGKAVQVDSKTGKVLNSVDVGYGVYSYSDFTGYALRHITINQPVYQTYIEGCGATPNFTAWNALGYTVDATAGTDIILNVRIVDDLANIPTATNYLACSSVQTGGCANPIDLTALGVPQGRYMVILATLVPKVCDPL